MLRVAIPILAGPASTDGFIHYQFTIRPSQHQRVGGFSSKLHHDRLSIHRRVHRINPMPMPCNGSKQSPFTLRAQSGSHKIQTTSSLQDYISLTRPITILQAVGAFLVGLLVILRHNHNRTISIQLTNVLFASLAIYFSYGAGMTMNDCIDASLDAAHGDKRNRSIASGRISTSNGWIFCTILCMVSTAFAGVASTSNNSNVPGFVIWNSLNLLGMASYAFKFQSVFLIKNILCGWLAISPLIGATLFSSVNLHDNAAILHKLRQLALIGFPLQLSREILKDIEDVDTDRGTKETLPLLIGMRKSKRIAYGIIAVINMAMVGLPYYWDMFASKPPVYALSLVVGVPMCFRAGRLSLVDGQKLLKKSIYVLLAGMIGGLLLQ